MGNAKCRGTYEQRKANPRGRADADVKREPQILGMVKREFDVMQHPVTKVMEKIVVTTRAKSGTQKSADGRTSYSYDGKQLRRVN